MRGNFCDTVSGICVLLDSPALPESNEDRSDGLLVVRHDNRSNLISAGNDNFGADKLLVFPADPNHKSKLSLNTKPMNAIYLEVGGRTYSAFEEPEFIGPQELRSDEKMVHEMDLAMPTIEKYERAHWTGRRFDWLFGVIMPSVCFFFDPIVFNGGSFEDEPLLGGMKGFAYTLSFVSVLGTMAWLIWGERLRAFSIFLSGLFAVAGVSSFFIGIFILPFSLMGLIVLIGALGFTPFFSSIVYLRNAIDAYQAAEVRMEPRTFFHAFALSLLASAIIPFLFN